jgi:hypothetical protein
MIIVWGIKMLKWFFLFLVRVVAQLLSFQYWSRWRTIEVVLMCGRHFISAVWYLPALRAAMAFTCQSQDH